MNALKDFYKGKRVFITGHTGFKGSWLTATLLSFGSLVKGYALPPPDSPALFNILKLKSKTDNVFADIRDIENLKKEIASFRPDIVIHLAAQPLVLESYKDPVNTYSTNVMGTVNILEACRNVESIKAILNVTTDKVYENTERQEGYREDEKLCGFDPYSNSKSCSELVTYSYKNSFYNAPDAPGVSTARSGNVIGGGDFAENRIVPDCVRAVSAGKDIIVRNPNSVRPYQHVLECLRGYLMLVKAQFEDKKFAQSFNFGPDGDGCVTTGELAGIFCRAWGGGARWVAQNKDGPHEANFLRLDCSKAKNMLKWYPKLIVSDAVNLTAEWSKSYLQGKDITIKQIDKYFNDI